MAFQFKPDTVLFFVEAFKRWGQKSPKYMRIWKTVNWVIAAVASSALAIIKLSETLPPMWAQIALWVVAFSTAWGGAMNTLVVSKPVDLPLTEKKNIEKVEKELAKGEAIP